MDIKSKLQKMIHIIQINQNNIENLPMLLDSLETYHKLDVTTEETSLVPTEANFQLPNIFLRTKKIPEVDKFIKIHRNKKGDLTMWNKNISRILEILDEYEIGESEDLTGSVEIVDHEVLKKSILRRF